MIEACNTRIARPVIASAAEFRTRHKFDMIARKVIKGDERMDVTQFRFFPSPSPHPMLKLFKRASSLHQSIFIIYLKADGLLTRISVKIAKRMSPLIRAKVKRIFTSLANLQTDNPCRKGFGRVQIAGPEADIGQVSQFNHAALLTSTRSCHVISSGNSTPSRHSLPHAQSASRL